MSEIRDHISMLKNIIFMILGIILVSSAITSVHAQPSIARVVNTGLVLKDQLGRDVFHASADKLILVESVLKSYQVRNQPFAYIVQIKDANEVTVFLGWLNGQLEPEQELKVSQSWVPEQGHYFIEAFVWAAVDNPDPLSPTREREIDVLPATQSLPFDFNISADPESLKIQKGKSTELLVTVEPIGEEVHNVRLFLDNVPNGISVALKQDFTGNRPPYSLPIKISVANSMVLGTYSFDIVGESGTISRSTTVKVTVVKEDLKSSRSSSVKPALSKCKTAPYQSDELTLKERIWVSVKRVESNEITGECTIVTLKSIQENMKLGMILKGADSCRDGTGVCEVSYGVSRAGDSEDYELSLSTEEARLISKEIRFTIGEYRNFGYVVYDNKYYLLDLLTTDEETGVQIQVNFVENISYKPISLKRGESLNYTLVVKTFATYGKLAQIDLHAQANARDSGIEVRFEPNKLVIPERNEAKAKLIIDAGENARDGTYDISISGRINGGAGGYMPSCYHSASCPVVQIGNSDWQIRTYGSDSWGSMGGKKAPQWLRAEIETDKDIYSKGESVEIKAYIINDSKEKIVLSEDRRLIIQIQNLYGIDAYIFDGKPIVLEPESRIILARPFYWDQSTFEGLVTLHNVEEGSYTIDLSFSGYQGSVFYDQKQIKIVE